jgi:hypothetical protein
MADLQSALRTHDEAVNAFLKSARAVPAAQWSQPRAAGKWSPSQVTEHLALAYETSRAVLQGARPGGAAPRFLRPLLRAFLLQPVLRSGGFMRRARSPKAMRPTGSPVPPETLLNRVQAAARAFEKYAAAAQTTTIDHPFFGRVPLADFVRFQEIHTQHHHKQLPGTAA